ncbi:MAG: cupin domain-containing protein [Phycisphaerales bacterium]
MRARLAVELAGLQLDVVTGAGPEGSRVLAGLVDLAERAMADFHRQQASGLIPRPAAAVGRLRGTGRGVSSTRLIEELERAHPLTLSSPFEGSDRVSGGVWLARDVLGNGSTTSVAKLRWESRAVDLPMHVHEHSDRLIVVHKGRGFFHVTSESVDGFTGTSVRSIPARERDVFHFTRGVVHTFSTDTEPMVLLSCQHPFLPFDHPDQYRIPRVRWVAADHQDEYGVGVGCDAAWTLLTGC